MQQDAFTILYSITECSEGSRLVILIHSVQQSYHSRPTSKQC